MRQTGVTIYFRVLIRASGVCEIFTDLKHDMAFLRSPSYVTASVLSSKKKNLWPDLNLVAGSQGINNSKKLLAGRGRIEGARP